MWGITFSSSIDLGHVLEALTSLIVFVGIIFTLRGDVKSLKGDMSFVKEELKKLTEVMISIARTDERLNAMDKRIDDVVHTRRNTNAEEAA